MNRGLLVLFSLMVVLCLFGWSCTGGESVEPPSEQDAVERVEPIPDEPNPALLVPGLAHEQAPTVFRVKFETTKGPFIVTVNREWAPKGADRLFNLVKIGFFEEIAFFRAIEGFVVQFGISGDPEVNSQWATARIKDDPVKSSNKRGYLTFAMAGPNSRTTQVFVNLRDNLDLDSRGFAPIGRVTEGLSVIDSLYTGYGEMAPRGKGPKPKVLNRRGNKYLKMQFPELDYIKNASFME
jgi:peptidyl-prolyl cis-trans isomerase A (cyclophilin A)